jgi:hypothetical protein
MGTTRFVFLFIAFVIIPLDNSKGFFCEDLFLLVVLKKNFNQEVTLVTTISALTKISFQEAYSSTEPLAVRNCLTLKSPFGSLKKVYDWPLRKGRGNIRKSEDKEDEAAEIFETIK